MKMIFNKKYTLKLDEEYKDFINIIKISDDLKYIAISDGSTLYITDVINNKIIKKIEEIILPDSFDFLGNNLIYINQENNAFNELIIFNLEYLQEKKIVYKKNLIRLVKCNSRNNLYILRSERYYSDYPEKIFFEIMDINLKIIKSNGTCFDFNTISNTGKTFVLVEDSGIKIYNLDNKKMIGLGDLYNENDKNIVGCNFCLIKDKYILYTEFIIGRPEIYRESRLVLLDLKKELRRILIKRIFIEFTKPSALPYSNIKLINKNKNLFVYSEHSYDCNIPEPIIFDLQTFKKVKIDFTLNNEVILDNDIYYSIKNNNDIYELELGTISYEE
ncbi:MAG: hypothetical protein U0457_12580 [Candidatus Sericytochromatia bacterium]